jgi:hypothetical protein
METEASAQPAGRPRPWLLAALALAVALALVSWLLPGKSAAPAPAPSKPRTAAKAKTVDTVEPADLDVRLDALKQARPGTESSDRNPFRFYVKPPPPPPPSPPASGRGSAEVSPPVVPAGPVGPPPPPPIPLKFIGVMEVPGLGKVAAFSDCRATMRGREGEVVAGQYRLVRIGVESVVMEYVDGRGRTTIRMSGQECVGK